MFLQYLRGALRGRGEYRQRVFLDDGREAVEVLAHAEVEDVVVSRWWVLDEKAVVGSVVFFGF